VVTVQHHINVRAAQRRANGSVGPVHPWHDFPSRRHRAGALTRGSEVAAHHPGPHTKICPPAWSRCNIISMHGRHSVEPTAPLDQCTRGMTLQAVGTALVRSHAVLKLLLITPWHEEHYVRTNGRAAVGRFRSAVSSRQTVYRSANGSV